ncbi:MAG: hypothetical protein KDA89_23610 [Planctomycetaceae bacterium]|nr:hypothetical protein [Planctomycetaceae bacterium]
MFFWLRELLGWALVAAALFLVRLAVSYISDPEQARVVEAGVIALCAMGVLRAGVLLIRVSTAARISMSEDNRRGQNSGRSGV